MKETPTQFESRKKDHIRIALAPESQSLELSQFDQIELVHEALPDLNFEDVDLSTSFFSSSSVSTSVSAEKKLKTPLFISSMTAGFQGSPIINLSLALAAEERGWAMGVGSQRRELFENEFSREWKQIRQEAPNAVLMANLGLTQIIGTPIDKIQRLIDGLEAAALFVHLNPLQEVLQKEGTPNFKGGMAAIENVVKSLNVPVIVKETGCGFSLATLQRLKNTGIAAVDVAGAGGTHWGKVEGHRAQPGDMHFEAAKTFAQWGISTVQSLINASEAQLPFEIWGSGGVRSGLDAAKLLALGAKKVGVAMPIMKAALSGPEELNSLMERYEYELKMALFCTGHRTPEQMTQKRGWTWK